MEKIFAVYCEVRLAETPEWLATFRDKYDKPYPFHLTLKQAARVGDKQLPVIRQLTKTVLHEWQEKLHGITVEFDDLQLDEHDSFDGTGWIYLFASQPDTRLLQFQTAIREALKDFSDYENPASYGYEHDFKPHITIGRELAEGAFQEAIRQIPPNHVCTGMVTQLVVSSIDDTPHASVNPPSLTTYKL